MTTPGNTASSAPPGNTAPAPPRGNTLGPLPTAKRLMESLKPLIAWYRANGREVHEIAVTPEQLARARKMADEYERGFSRAGDAIVYDGYVLTAKPRD